MDIKHLFHRSGQAMVELLVGLVGLVILIVGLLQVGILGRAETENFFAARREMGADLFSGTQKLSTPTYMSGWDNGADGIAYTADDVPMSGDAGDFLGSLASLGANDSLLEDLEGFIPTNRFSDFTLLANANVCGNFDIAVQVSESDAVELLPGIRRLVYNQESITFKRVLYMPLIENVLDVEDE